MENMNLDQKLTTAIETLKQQRDQLRVQLNLASAEAKDELAKVEAKMEELEKQFNEKKDAVMSVASDAGKDISAAFELMTGEISKAFENIKSKIQ